MKIVARQLSRVSEFKMYKMRQRVMLSTGPLTELPRLPGWILVEARGRQVNRKTRQRSEDIGWEKRDPIKLGKKSTPLSMCIHDVIHKTGRV